MPRISEKFEHCQHEINYHSIQGSPLKPLKNPANSFSRVDDSSFLFYLCGFYSTD